MTAERRCSRCGAELPRHYYPCNPTRIERLVIALLGIGCGICLAGYALHSQAAAVLGLMAMGAGSMVEAEQ